MLYSCVFIFLFAFFVVTLASKSMISAVRRAYCHALRDELRVIAASGDRGAVRRALAARRSGSDDAIEVVTATISTLGIDISTARRGDGDGDGDGDAVAHFVSTRLPESSEEAYLVSTFLPTLPAAIAYAEISRMLLPTLIGALFSAVLLTLMLSRIIVPPLTALAALARDPSIRGEQLSSDSAPNEIIEVAQTFRRTVRQLHEERERIAIQHRELEQMHQSLVRASKLASVGRLAAGIAHEIGNPLAAVQGYLALIPRLDERERHEVLERSAREVKRIHETIRKLLSYARQEESCEPTRPLNLANVVREAVLLVRGHPAFREVEIVSELPLDDEPDALGHSGQMGQVLVNILLNAAQAMEGRATNRITIRKREAGPNVFLEIDDTGPGIPEGKHEQIFDPFYTTKAPGEGTGLGLAVSRSLVESMNGSLEACSIEGAGARFTLMLERPRI